MVKKIPRGESHTSRPTGIGSHPYHFVPIESGATPIQRREGVQTKQVRGLDRVMQNLKDWNRVTFGNVLAKLNKVREDICELNKLGMTGDLVGRRRELEREEDRLMEQEEVLWFQRAKADEFKWGDRNSKFFHKKANGRSKRNKLTRLVDDDGMEWRSRQGMTGAALDYFENLFKTNL